MSGVLLGWVIPVVHILACLFLVVVVLLQTGKGADMGAVFGGGSQTLFGSGGAGNFLTKLTTATAIAFMVTSLLLSYGQSREPKSRLLERLPAPGAEEPALPAEAPAPGTGDAPGNAAPEPEANNAPAADGAPAPAGAAPEQPAPAPATP